MPEYCKQCYDGRAADDVNTLTLAREASIVCEGCGETIVDSKGRCTGACGKEFHASKFMAHIFETRPPGFQFASVNNKSFRGRIFKISADLMQWIPRIAFVFGLFYMFGMVILLRLFERGKAPEAFELAAELAAARATNFYDRSLNFWYLIEMKLENMLFR